MLFSTPQQPIPRLPLCFASNFHILGNRPLLGIVDPQPARILGCVSGSPSREMVSSSSCLLDQFTLSTFLAGAGTWPAVNQCLPLPWLQPCRLLLGPYLWGNRRRMLTILGVTSLLLLLPFTSFCFRLFLIRMSLG